MKVVFVLMIMLAVNMFLFLGQGAVDNITTTEGIDKISFFDYEGSTMGDFDAGNYTLDDNLAGSLPEGQAQITTEDNNAFTDTFATIKNWFLDSTGLSYLYGIVTAVPNFLKNIGLPAAVSFALGFFWWVTTLFLIVAFIKGNY